MSKKLIISLSTIGVVAAIAIGGTIAYFNDVETSTGNILVAGTLDLKVDHTKETYNDIDCKTCSVNVISDTSNQVTAKSPNGLDQGPFPHNAVLVSVINPAWTANIPDARWIWWTDPTPLAEYGIDTIYTFEKTFDWYGPIEGATLQLSIGADNSYEIYLNNNWVAGDNTEQNYNAAGQDTITGAPISNQIVQGANTLKFVVKNWLRPQGQNWANPGGLLYKLVIDGQCGDDYFKTNCQLWGLTDLTNQHFWMFDDVKPGDRGTNVISLHADGNDAYVCMLTNNEQNDENGLTDSELALDDDDDTGELSQYLNLVVWEDKNGDGTYNPPTEGTLYVGGFDDLNANIDRLAIAGNGSDNLGIAWCLGTQTVNEDGSISCSGAGNQDNAQTDKLLADLVLYSTQQRNNTDFDCSDVQLP